MLGACAALGVAAWGVWLHEVVEVKGWSGLAWLGGMPRAEWAGSGCAAAAIALPFGVRRAARAHRLALAALAVAPVGWLSFQFGRAALYGLFGRGQALLALLEPALWERHLASSLALLLGAAALTAVAAPLSLRWLGGVRVGWRLAALELLALALVLPASLLTIALFPALRGQTDLVHAVKMGYPAGWTPLLLGAASFLALGRAPAERGG